jgi:serine/threonine-protein kinase
MSPDCPGAEALRRWLAGGADAPVLDAHVEGCPACQRAVEALLGGAAPARGRPAAAETTTAPADSVPAFLKRLGDEAGRAVRSALAPPVPTLPVGAATEPGAGLPPLPAYEALSPLGRGGMGEVWLARDRRLRRDVAVKVMKEELAGHPELRRRFLEEAQVASQLQHPAIPPVHELGELPDGRPFFAMKVVRGRTLADLLAARPGPAEDLPRFLAIFEQVCQALAYAHSKGVIHRDLKPANVMVGAFGEVQVMDWGLAKVLTAAPPAGAAGSAVETVRTVDTDHATQAGSVLGTYAYMPPEQARGEVGLLDRRCDVFGLGAMLCEVLTGRPPYVGTFEEVRAQAQLGHVAPARRRLGACGADRQLVELTERSLSARAEERPADAAAVAAALTAYLAGVQERLRRAELERATAQARAAEQRKRRRVQRALAAALLLLAVGGAGAGLWYRHDQASRAAELATRQAETDREVTAAVQEAAALIERPWSETDSPERWAATIALAEKAVQRARGALATGKPTEELAARVAQAQAAVAEAGRDSRLRAALDRTRLDMAAETEGHFDFAACVPRYRQALAEYGVDPAAAEVAAARLRRSRLREALLASLEDWAAATTDPEERARLNALLRAQEPDADAFRARWRAARERGDRGSLALLARGPEARGLPPVAVVRMAHSLIAVRQLAIAERLLAEAQERSPGDFWLNYELGMTLLEGKRPGEALHFLTAALALRGDSAGVHLGLSNALREAGDRDTAVRHLRRALELDPTYALAHNNLGGNLYETGDLEGATRQWQLALECDPKLACAHLHLGMALCAKGDGEGGIRHYRLAIEFDPAFAQAHNNLGSALLYQGRYEEAEAAFREALRLRPDYFLAHRGVGESLLGQGRYSEAEAACRAALRVQPDSPDARCNLGLALNYLGRFGEAEAVYREVLRDQPSFPVAWVGLGEALYGEERYAEAEAAWRRALRLEPGSPPTHYCLGRTLRRQGRNEEAEAAYREAIRLRPGYAKAYCNLGDVLEAQGRFAEALEARRRGHELGSKTPGWKYPSADWVRACERLVELERRLVAVRGGAAEPAGPAECLELARLCQQYKRLPVTAARLYAAAFAEGQGDGRRYDAARAAVTGACGQGEDARSLPDKVALMLRRQALAWLRADLALSATAGEAGVQAMRQRLARWRQDPELAPVRDGAVLDRLPEDERRPWHQLWEEVAALLKSAEARE